jgi:hypothetical protein
MQWIDLTDSYELKAFDGMFVLECNLPKSDTADTTDFETYFKTAGNISPNSTVTTAFENTNKDLRLARGLTTITAPATQTTISLRIPGTFGSGDGRYVLGGYAISELYDKDDYVTVEVDDTDRCIAWAVALAMNPAATAPLSDAAIIAAGVLPAPIGQAFPNYPMVKTYTDIDMAAANQGWYFWPLANGATPCAGECEVNPIGGYGFLPSGLYLTLVYNRPCALNGTMRINIDWGKLN